MVRYCKYRIVGTVLLGTNLKGRVVCTQTPNSHFLALNHTRRIGFESMSLAKQNAFFPSC